MAMAILAGALKMNVTLNGPTRASDGRNQTNNPGMSPPQPGMAAETPPPPAPLVRRVFKSVAGGRSAFGVRRRDVRPRLRGKLGEPGP